MLKTIVVNRVVNYRQFKEYILFELEECAWRIGNSKQNEEGIEKKGTIYERTLQRKQQELFIKKQLKQLKQLSRQSTSWRDKENNT